MPATKTKTNCPVCGMDVEQDAELKADYKGQSYYFCSKDDKKEFEKRPHVYTWKEHKEHKGKSGKAA